MRSFAISSAAAASVARSPVSISCSRATPVLASPAPPWAPRRWVAPSLSRWSAVARSCKAGLSSDANGVAAASLRSRDAMRASTRARSPAKASGSLSARRRARLKMTQASRWWREGRAILPRATSNSSGLSAATAGVSPRAFSPSRSTTSVSGTGSTTPTDPCLLWQLAQCWSKLMGSKSRRGWFF